MVPVNLRPAGQGSATGQPVRLPPLVPLIASSTRWSGLRGAQRDERAEGSYQPLLAYAVLAVQIDVQAHSGCGAGPVLEEVDRGDDQCPPSGRSLTLCGATCGRLMFWVRSGAIGGA